MRIRKTFFLLFVISILFAGTAESKMLGKNQAVYSGKLKTITASKGDHKLSVNKKTFFIKQTSDNKLLRKAENLIYKNVKIIYNKKNYCIVSIGLSKQQLKY